MNQVIRVCAFALVVVAMSIPFSAAQGQEPGPVRVYDHLLNPAEHPDYQRRHVQPPTWETFGNRTQFVALRGFAVEDGRIVNFQAELDKWTKQHELCSVVWPSYPIVFAENLGELADAIKQRDLFLFDIWGYVPGSGPGGYWTQFRVPEGVFDMLEEKLGDHWLGMDIGEQDGRYIGGYGPSMYPISEDRIAQYLNFHRHFEYMGDQLGNRLSTLVSLNFGHHLIKDGTYSTIGAETAQALPNSQVYYAFIRGAGKQYGVPWFGNASIFNRWGYKTYDSEANDHSPTKGSSLNLLKRLMYSHILYNCVFVGFESQWFVGDELSPIGNIQLGAKRWLDENGMPGTMLTPVAVMTDFFAGWTFPRHLYTGSVYRVWGNLPYGPGDYLTDNVLDMLYPGYQDASYFHNEFGFLTATPYGDAADCLLTDAPAWVLNRYGVVVLTGEVDATAELRDKLEAYIEQGGHVVITAGNLAGFEQGLAGTHALNTPVHIEQGTKVSFGDGTSVTEDMPFDLFALGTGNGGTVLATCGGRAAAVEVVAGSGRVTVLASPFGIAAAAAATPIGNGIDEHFRTPYPMLKHVSLVLDRVLKEQRLFEVAEGLGYVTCRKGPGEYTLGVFNNGLEQREMKIISLFGPVRSMRELPLDQSEKTATGFLPEGFEGVDVGASGENAIAGGDVRVFAVTVENEQVSEIPHAVPAAVPRGRILPLRHVTSLREAILRRPTFFQHFDGIALDWRGLYNRDEKALADEGGWLERQGMRVYVDLTSGINLFPDLRLVDNDAEEYAKSMAMIDTVMRKMNLIGAKNLILDFHRNPENNFSAEQTAEAFRKTFGALAAKAGTMNMTLYLRTGHGVDLNTALAFVREANLPNLKIAASIAALMHEKTAPETIRTEMGEYIGLWLASTPRYDAVGALWSRQGRIIAAERKDQPEPAAFLTAMPEVPCLLDGVYANWDEEYLDVRELEQRVGAE